MSFQNVSRGYTIVELMVTIVIVSVLAATVGAFFVKLLTIQERDREEGYIREKLADICGAYADMMSVGSYIGTRTNIVSKTADLRVFYRHETGGISLETGVVTHVAQLTSSLNQTNGTLDVGVDAFESGELVRKLSRRSNGDASLIPLAGDVVSCTLVPLGDATSSEKDGFDVKNAALAYLEVAAKYKIKNDDGEFEVKTARAGRLVRLWNRE